MDTVFTSMSTGLPELDEVLNGIIPGDNVVWQVNSIEDYIPFVKAFCKEGIKENRELIYFRFAEHHLIVPKNVKLHKYTLNPEQGFETFISQIFDVIEKYGRGAYYVFDCLSALTVDWYSDRMLGNFFMLTCPYLYDWETATYFALLKNSHLANVIKTIHNTAQVVIDVYRNKGLLYIHPLKVYKRSSPTMYMLHQWQENKFEPVTNSVVTAEIMTSIKQPWLDFSVQQLDTWTQTLEQAYQTLEKDKKHKNYQFNRLLRMAITRDERLLQLAEKYLDLSYLVKITKRMIGTGLIGGKSVGMLLSRAILEKSDQKWLDILEAHDSFFIGSDVFYTYLIENGCWWLRRKWHKQDTDFEGTEAVRQLMLNGTFPDEIQAQFMEMLDYFGQSPIIVRSSSLLEDAYGNAFSGKYESVFCANQGAPENRLNNFMKAVRVVYASAVKKEALLYRKHWGLLDRDEQMALLVQRVSGVQYKNLFFPHAAGVGFSFNPFVWHNDIDPQEGMIRLVFGLGTRAVERSDDDYTRIIALNAPHKRPETNLDQVRKYAQQRVDYLDLNKNEFISGYFKDVAELAQGLPLNIFASFDKELSRRAGEYGIKNLFPYIISFDKLISDTRFISDIKEMLKLLEQAYNYPVDIEFTVNFLDQDNFKINLVQCRPFQVKGEYQAVKLPENLTQKNIILKTQGPIIGSNRVLEINQIIYIEPATYSKLNENDRYQVARLIGKLTHLKQNANQEKDNIMLIGPGRWGTTSPSLGVPVSFSEINTVSVICEIAYMHENLIPDVSLGTHFFNDLVEMDISYLALYPERENYFLNKKFLTQTESITERLIGNNKQWAAVIKVFTAKSTGDNKCFFLNINSIEQKGILYLD